MMNQKRRSIPTRREVTALLIVVVVALAIAGAAQALTPDDSSGQNSAYTRTDLTHSWRDADRFPLLVPDKLPADADATDETGFVLWSIVVDPAEQPSRRTWVSYYDGSALGPHISFRVFQRPDGAKPKHACGPIDQSHITRRTPTAVITICSEDIDKPQVKRYWRTVHLTSEYDDVKWLKN